MRVHHGTRCPSVLSSFSYTADLRHSFITELQGIGALHKTEITDLRFRVTKDVPVLRLHHLTLERILPSVWEIVSSSAPMVKRCDGIKLKRASDPVRNLWPYTENRFCPHVGGRWRYTSGVIVPPPVGVFLGLETATFRQQAKTGRHYEYRYFHNLSESLQQRFDSSGLTASAA